MPVLRIPTNKYGYYRIVQLPDPKRLRGNSEVTVSWWNSKFSSSPRPLYRICRCTIAQLYEILFYWKRGLHGEVLRVLKSLVIVKQERPTHPKKARNKTFKEIRAERSERKRLATLQTEELEKELKSRRIKAKCKHIMEAIGLDDDNPHWVVWKHPPEAFQVADIRNTT